MTPTFLVHEGDALESLKEMPDSVFNTCMTSPPYWRKVDYHHPGQLGQEKTPEEFVGKLAAIFDEVKRSLRDDGTCWIVIDDTYFKKELSGIPWMLAFEMKRRGWIWRAEIVWHKPGVKPEPCKDRPTRSHEAILLFSKQRNGYYFNQMLEPHTNPWAIDCIKKAQESGQTERPRSNPFSKEERRAKGTSGITRAEYGVLMNPNGKNRRDVWTIKTRWFKKLHFAVYPEELVKLCLAATCPPGGMVLDPFAGAGTTGVVAVKNDMNYVGIELVAASAALAREEINLAVDSLPKSATVEGC
jgi:DNA modification methylase